MRTLLIILGLGISVNSGFAQTQQAGADGGKTDEAFNALIAKCDNTDLLVKRGKVRLILGRIDEEAAKQAQAKIDGGFAKCGEGDMEAAGVLLDEAFEIADAASTESFGTDSVAESAVQEEETSTAEAAEDKPWWKFW